MKASLQRLRAEVQSDLAAFDEQVEILGRLDLRQPSVPPGDVALAALGIHHAYGAIEAALARLARLLEGSVPGGAEWHQDLLESMALEIPSVRPAILGSPSVEGLRRLLGFRHFFRHAYRARLDPVRLADLRDVAGSLREPLHADFARLDRLLLALADSAGAT